MPDIGSMAPTFSLPDTKREQVSLADLRGQNVVIAFFPAAFTGVCKSELCSFRDALADLGNLDAAVLAISVDGPFTNGEFSEQNKLGFPVLSDVKHEVIKAYDVVFENFVDVDGYQVATRSVFVLDKEGVVRWSWHAPNPGVEPDYAAVKAAVAELKG